MLQDDAAYDAASATFTQWRHVDVKLHCSTTSAAAAAAAVLCDVTFTTPRPLLMSTDSLH